MNNYKPKTNRVYGQKTKEILETTGTFTTADFGPNRRATQAFFSKLHKQKKITPITHYRNRPNLWQVVH